MRWSVITPLARDEHELERLRLHAEAVLAELDDVVAAAGELRLVAERAERVLARGLDLRLDLVGADGVAEREELRAEVAELEDHRVGREVRVQLVDVRERLRAAHDARDDALGGGHQVLRAAMALVEELLPLRADGVVHLLALLREVGGELVELAELAFELLELEEQLRHLLVARLGRVAERDRAGDGLAEEPELRAELGLALADGELLLAALPHGARAVLLRERGRRRPRGCACARWRRRSSRPPTTSARSVSPCCTTSSSSWNGASSRRLLDLLDGDDDGVEAIDERLERVLLRKNATHALLTSSNCAATSPSSFATAWTSTPRSSFSVMSWPRWLRSVVSARRKSSTTWRSSGRTRRSSSFWLARRLRERLVGALLDGLDLVELVEDEPGGLLHRRDGREDVARLGVSEPVVRVDRAIERGDEVLVRRARGALVRGEAAQAERVGDAAHEIGVADLAEVARVARRGGRVLHRAERRAPDLHRVDARRLGDGAEERHRPVGEQAVAVRAERARDLLADQVVREEQVLAVAALVVDVEDVLAVRRLELALELEVLVRCRRRACSRRSAGSSRRGRRCRGPRAARDTRGRWHRCARRASRANRTRGSGTSPRGTASRAGGSADRPSPTTRRRRRASGSRRRRARGRCPCRPWCCSRP